LRGTACGNATAGGVVYVFDRTFRGVAASWRGFFTRLLIRRRGPNRHKWLGSADKGSSVLIRNNNNNCCEVQIPLFQLRWRDRVVADA